MPVNATTNITVRQPCDMRSGFIVVLLRFENRRIYDA
jgi:hypothetical protein